MQQLDDQIAKKENLKAILPKELTDLQMNVEDTRAAADAVKAKLDENSKVQKARENDIKTNKATADKYEAQLLTVKTNKEYKALNSEIAHLKEQNGKLDEGIIALMDEEANLRKEFQAADKLRIAAEKELEANEEKLRQRLAEVENDAEVLRKERNEMSNVLPKPLQKRYFLLIKTKGRKAVAFMENESCNGCGFKVRPQLAIEIRTGNKIHSCESCGRIITIKPEE
jgi:predicted  nucleic acid-binding Zn-ribbon protein